jgi:outer membrane usher protein
MRRLSAARPRRLAIAMATLLLAMIATAQAQDEVLLLDLCLNARCSGVAAVVVRDGRVLIDREALLAAGLDPTALPPEQIGGRAFVDPAALGHGIEVTVDREALRVDLVQRAADMPGQVVDLRTRARTDIAAQPWTAFVNYAASAGDSGDGGAGLESVFLDGAVGRGHAALRSTAFWDRGNGWRRGLARFELDQPQHLRRWTLGDQFAIARDPLGGGALIGGFGVERAFDQDPYLTTFPQPFYQGVIEAPGVVEVYANGALIGRREVGPGPVNLQNLGVPPGRSDVRIVVRDPFGNRRELAASTYYGSSVLLTPGLTDYALRVGAMREGSSFGGGYGDAPAWQGWVRRGFSDRITLGVRGEGDDSFVNAGVDAALRTDFGEFAIALSASDDEDAGRGDAASASYGFGNRVIGVAFGARRFSNRYRNLGMRVFDDIDDDFDDDIDDPFGAPLREDDYANLSWSPWTRLSLQLGYGRQRREGLAVERTATLAASWRASNRAQLLASVQRSDGLYQDTVALLSLNYAFDRDSVAFSVRDDDLHADDGSGGSGGRSVGFDARRSRPPGIGWGYDASVQRFEGEDSGYGQLEYQGRHGRYAVQVDHFGDDTSGRVLASGALVGIGGRAYATPPLESGFALVRVPGVADVPVLRENLEVGRTDARGDLLVRDLIPYYANRVALDPSQVPLSYEIERGARTLAVPRNTGALATLEVRPLHAVSGRLRLRVGDDARPAAFGTLRLQRDDARHGSPLGAGGRFYFDRLPPGRYRASADSDGAHAECTIEVPAPTAPGIVDLGIVDCAATAATER